MHYTRQERLKLSKSKAIVATIKLLVLLLIVVIIPLYLYFFHEDFLMRFRDFDDIVRFLEKYKLQSIPIYVILQIMQIVISVLPGQFFQLAAGYLYTFWPALLLSIAGALLGTTITFWLAKWLGSDFVHMFFDKDKTGEYVERLNSKKAYTIVFLLYAIPGIPKDVVSYAAGISEMKYKPFIILSTIGRLPGMMGSIIIGSMWHKEEYIGMVVMAVIAVVAFTLSIIFRKRIHQLLDKAYDKLNGL